VKYLVVISLLWIFYVYVGFPVVLWLRATLFPITARPVRTSVAALPLVSVVICAHNEAADIEIKLDSLSRQSYPTDRIEIIVASDGSTDLTNNIVLSYARRPVQLLALPRRGKVATLNAAVVVARGNIIVFTDANSILAEDAIGYLVEEFRDPDVGGVAGDQIYAPQTAAGSTEGERTYWNLERWLKRWQSRSGSVTSATGALHALRAELFEPIPEGVTDDFAISTLAIRNHKRLIFCEKATAVEAPTGAANNYARKRRIMTRGLNSVRCRAELLNPRRYGFYAHQLLIQKVVRRLTFVPLALLLLSTLMLAGQSHFYALLSLAQLAFWGIAYYGSRQTGHMPRVLQMSGYFWTINAAAIAAAGDFLRGHRVDIWNPRGGESDHQ